METGAIFTLGLAPAAPGHPAGPSARHSLIRLYHLPNIDRILFSLLTVTLDQDRFAITRQISKTYLENLFCY